MLSVYLSWAVARAYEGKNSLSIEEARSDFEEHKQKYLAKIAKEAPELLSMSKLYWNQRRTFSDQLLPSFRASLSRSLKRLEARGLIRREIHGTRPRWTKPKTVGIFLTAEGREIARHLSPLDR